MEKNKEDIKDLKEIKIDEVEILMLEDNNKKRQELIYQLGQLENDYLIRKSQLVSRITQNDNELSTLIKTLKKKYKIIGNIISYDIDKKKLIISS